MGTFMNVVKINTLYQFSECRKYKTLYFKILIFDRISGFLGQLSHLELRVALRIVGQSNFFVQQKLTL